MHTHMICIPVSIIYLHICIIHLDLLKYLEVVLEYLYFPKNQVMIHKMIFFLKSYIEIIVSKVGLTIDVLADSTLKEELRNT